MDNEIIGYGCVVIEGSKVIDGMYRLGKGFRPTQYQGFYLYRHHLDHAAEAIEIVKNAWSEYGDDEPSEDDIKGAVLSGMVEMITRDKAGIANAAGKFAGAISKIFDLTRFIVHARYEDGGCYTKIEPIEETNIPRIREYLRERFGSGVH